MKYQHTPGPWRTAGEQGVQIRSERDQIAKVWTMRGNEWKANARLIAAAPDLLEFVEYIRRTGDSRLASMAIAVISKATEVDL